MNPAILLAADHQNPKATNIYKNSLFNLHSENENSVRIYLVVCVFYKLCQLDTKPPPINQKTATPTTKTENKGSISGRGNFVKNLKSSMVKEGSSMELSEENKDVLNVKSSKISNYNLLQDFKDLFEDLRNDGFREINFTDSSGEKRNVNLEILDK